MSGVKNLRAMFEGRGENNPPDRGRSPGPGGLTVERDGRVGLRREHSGESVSVMSQRLSSGTEATTPQPALEKPEVVAVNMANNTAAVKSNLSQDSFSETPQLEAPSESSSNKDGQSPNLAPNPNPDKITDEEEPGTKLLPGNPTEKLATQGDSLTPPGRNGAPSRGSSVASKTKTTPAITTKSAPKASPVSTSTKSVSKALKSPNTLKPALSVAKGPTNPQSQAPQKKATPAPPKDQNAPKKTTTNAAVGPKPTTATKKPKSIELAPPSAGFVKPKARSPTRPLKLPASLTSHTSSSFKTGTSATAHPPRQSLSRASVQNLNVSAPTHRSPSRTSISTTGTTSNAKTLRRQSSTISRPRPSLGPPPKQPARDHPVSKKEGHVDESFLARMMRPTQSSSSKTSEKTPVTPPRKQNAASTAHKKPIAKDAEANAKKATAKLQSSTKVKTSTKPANEDAPTAKEVAPILAQTETSRTPVPTTPDGNKEEVVVEKVSAMVEDTQKVEDIDAVVQEAVEGPVDQMTVVAGTEPTVVDEEPSAVQEEEHAPTVNYEAAPTQNTQPVIEGQLKAAEPEES
ncbi:hypothetical protein AAE478_009135 [Parahypoxylon ruwenzoriense]